jgi:hypothetical protein
MAERRKHRRLSIQLDILCRKVGGPGEEFSKGSTLNVSTGGLYFQTASSNLRKGDLLNVELDVPPTSGLLELGGTMSSLGRVLRIGEIEDPMRGIREEYGVAVEFCQSPKFSS